MHTQIMFALAFVVVAAAPASAQFQASAGFSDTAFAAAPGGAFVAGLTRLPSGNLAVFDGASVVEFDPFVGAQVGVLYTPPTNVFGSFLATDPNGAFMLFGESSAGTITRIPLNGSPPSTLAILPFNYDGALDAAGMNVYVARASASLSGTDLVRIDLVAGTQTLIATVPGPSGPVAFDASGNLLYGENSPFFPAPLGSGRIYAFSAGQLENVGTQPLLTDVDATPIATGLNAISDLLVDAEGDLIVADSIYGTIVTVSAAGSFKASIGESTTPHTGVTALAFVDDGASHPARFDAFQPAAGGTLAAFVSDFSSTNDIELLVPKRAHFEVTPANPVPTGAFTLSLVEAPASGLSLILIATNSSAQESLTIANEVPFFFALLPPTVVVVGFAPLDFAGTLTLPAMNPGIGASIAVQAALVTSGFDLVGTSEAFVLTLQ